MKFAIDWDKEEKLKILLIYLSTNRQKGAPLITNIRDLWDKYLANYKTCY
jgi:hypothetical protein